MTDSGEFIYEARVTCEVAARTTGEEAVLHRTLSWDNQGAAPGEEEVAEDEMGMEAGLVFWEVRREWGTGSP